MAEMDSIDTFTVLCLQSWKGDRPDRASIGPINPLYELNALLNADVKGRIRLIGKTGVEQWGFSRPSAFFHNEVS